MDRPKGRDAPPDRLKLAETVDDSHFGSIEQRRHRRPGDLAWLLEVDCRELRYLSKREPERAQRPDRLDAPQCRVVEEPVVGGAAAGDVDETECLKSADRGDRHA